MVHVLAAIGVEAGNDRSRRALALYWTAAGTRARDVLRHLGLRIVEALRNIADEAAFTGSHVDRGAHAASETAKRASGARLLETWSA